MKRSIFVACLLAGQLFWACSSGGDNPPVKTPEELLADGWKAFSSRNYQLALTDFNSAAQGKPSLADAFNGAGWANAKLNSLAASVVDFTEGLGKSPGNVQIEAGLAFVFNAQKLYDSSITRGGEALALDGNWVFTRDTSINHFDLHLLLAEDYFARATPDYPASLVEVKILNPAFDADVSTLAGQTALAAEIERLGTVY